MRKFKSILITGGAGFIGSHLVRLFLNKYPESKIYNLDKLTYAGNLENLKDVENRSNYTLLKGDICDENYIRGVFNKFQFDAIIHLAAESHVDRSITSPTEFALTNIIGTINLLNHAKHSWSENYDNKVFYHVSTDEVYGSLGPEGYFVESTPYDPKSPYSASKASSDHFVRAYANTYKLPVVISNCSNNYGPNQFPEKLLPLSINNILKGKPLPIYGDGTNVRDWLYVEDHAIAIDKILHSGILGETYNIGGFNEWRNIDVINLLCEIVDRKLGNSDGQSKKLITFVKDRAGHDERYAIDASKIKNDLNWQPSLEFDTGLDKTVDWYLGNSDWLKNIESNQYINYYNENYQK